MTATSTATHPTARDLTGQMMADAARRMLPVIAGRILAAAADRAVEGVEGLADRLEDLGTPAESADDTGGPDAGDGGSGGRMSAAFAFLTEQTRIVLRFLARLAAQAAEMLRRATDRLRARRAPEGDRRGSRAGGDQHAGGLRPRGRGRGHPRGARARRGLTPRTPSSGDRASWGASPPPIEEPAR